VARVSSRQDQILAAALAYAQAGEAVLPLWWTDDQAACACPASTACKSPGKHPLTANGFYDATTDEQIVRRWLRKWPSANLGARSEFVSRIDVDLPDVARALKEERSLALQTRIILTPHDGLHIALWTPEPVDSAVLYLKDGRRLGELKAAGGYVVVPPSRIGQRYYELLSPCDVGVLKAEPTAWLSKLLPQFGYQLDLKRTERKHDYEALSGIIHEGEGRHNALLSYAGRIWFKGMASETFLALLRELNVRQCSPPLPDDELASIAQHYITKKEQSGIHVLEVSAPERSLSSRAVDGATFLLDAPATVEAVWGRDEQVLWARGEPMMLVGPQGVGKTTLTQQLVKGLLGLQSDVLDFPVRPAQRVLLVLADRPAQARRSFARMVREQDRPVLEERLVVWQGPLPFDLGLEPESFAPFVQSLGCDVVVIDSLKDVAVDLSKDEVGSRVSRGIQLALAAGLEIAICHHQRKATTGNAKPKSLQDVYGSVWLTASCGSVLLLWGQPGDSLVQLSHLKQPQEEVGPLMLVHDHESGMTNVQRKPDLLEALRVANGITAEQAARVLTEKSDPTDAQVEKARRQLRTLKRKNLAYDKEGAKGGAGGSMPTLWFAVDSNHDLNHVANSGASPTLDEDQSRHGRPQIQDANHDCNHANHATTNHVRPSLLEEGATWKAGSESLQESEWEDALTQ
jgi:replicative DNA helicase